LWIPVSIVNFLFVPEHFRVAFVAVVSFFWMIILSLIANKSDGKDEAVEKA
jgi:protein Mpv17